MVLVIGLALVGVLAAWWWVKRSRREHLVDSAMSTFARTQSAPQRPRSISERANEQVSLRKAASGALYRIEYADRNGEISQRDFRFERAWKASGRVKISAHCLLRNEERTFYAERMLSLHDSEGMKIANPVQYFEGLIGGH